MTAASHNNNVQSMASLDTTNEVGSAVDQTPPTSPSPQSPAAEPEEGGTLSPLSSSWKRQALSSDDQAKVDRILLACRERDLEALRDLAASENGLIEDGVRRTACKQRYPHCLTASGLSAHRILMHVHLRADTAGL